LNPLDSAIRRVIIPLPWYQQAGEWRRT
jgi:hypothetical protein